MFKVKINRMFKLYNWVTLKWGVDWGHSFNTNGLDLRSKVLKFQTWNRKLRDILCSYFTIINGLKTFLKVYFSIFYYLQQSACQLSGMLFQFFTELLAYSVYIFAIAARYATTVAPLLGIDSFPKQNVSILYVFLPRKLKIKH